MFSRRIAILLLMTAGLLLIPAVGMPYGVLDWSAYSQAYTTETPTFTLSPPATGTSTVTLTPTGTVTATPSASPTATQTAMPTATPTQTPTPSVTAAPSATQSATATATATETLAPTPSVTATPGATQPATATATATETLAPTPSATPTSTATPTATAPPGVGQIVGKVTVQGRTNAQGVRIEVDGKPVATTEPNGNFEATGVTAGTHVVRAFLAGYLPAEKAGVVVTAGQAINLSPVQLRGGDVNSDNVVGLLDLVLVASNYHTIPPADPRADINADGRIDLFDLVLVAGNYRRTGPTEWP